MRKLRIAVFAWWGIFARSAKNLKTQFYGPPRLNFCFTILPAGTFVLRPSPFKLLLYGPPHFRVILFYGPPHFRVILFYGPPLGIWSPPCRLINDNPLIKPCFDKDHYEGLWEKKKESNLKSKRKKAYNEQAYLGTWNLRLKQRW